MRTKILAAAIIATMALQPADAFSDPLDQPVTHTPTIRSELHRGSDIALSCVQHHVADTTLLDSCIDNAMRTQLLRSTASDAFKLGLYFTADVLVYIRYKFEKSSNLFDACKLYTLYVSDLERKMRLSNAELSTELKMDLDGPKFAMTAETTCK